MTNCPYCDEQMTDAEFSAEFASIPYFGRIISLPITGKHIKCEPTEEYMKRIQKWRSEHV